MEDLFKKIPSLVKSSSKRSSPSSSRSTTPSPPPTTLPPPLPTPDIPIQLPVGPLLPPPLITTGNSLGDPVPSANLPPPSLTQTAVFQRDRAAKVFEHSPLSNQLSPPSTGGQYQQQLEQIEKQRGRYRFRGESADARGLPSRSSSPRGKADERAGKKKSGGNLALLLSPTIPPVAGEVAVKTSRSRPAKTFEEILSIDGAPGADCTSSDDFAFCVTGSSATAFGTGFTTRRMRRDPITRMMKVYSDSAAPSWGEEGYSATGAPQPSFFHRADSLMFVTAEPGVVNSANQDEMGVLPELRGQSRVSTDDEPLRDDPQEMKGEEFGLGRANLEPHLNSHDENGSSPASSSSSISHTFSSRPEHRVTPENRSYIPQLDGSGVSRTRNLSDHFSAPAEPLGRPDPFGLRAAVPTEDAVRIAEEGHQVSFFQRCRDFFTSNVRNIKARTVHALTTGPDMNNSTDVDMDLEEPGESEEEMGARKAKAVARSWNRTDLVTCYSL